MKCVYCQLKAGFFKRICSDCNRLVETVQKMPPSFGYREFLDTLLETGINPEKIDKFIDADVDGRGSVNDHITARMTNQIMESLGTPTQMASTDVKKVRNDIAEGRAPSLVDQDVTEHSQLPHKH